MSDQLRIQKELKKLFRIVVAYMATIFLFALGLLIVMFNPNLFDASPKTENIVAIPQEVDEDRIENGIHVRTGLVDAEGLMTVVNNCTNCHSAKLLTQNRMNKERWEATIKWMQDTQGLWNLGDNHEIIINYLVSNYPPVKKGRRLVLSDIEWYELEE